MSSSLDKSALLAAAVAAAGESYAPYSKFPVGAALLTASGEIITGGNVENASYGLTICAERAAVFRAVAEGHREFQALALSVPGGGAPCGACRQVLHEFSPDLPILIGDESGVLVREITLPELLPHSFGPDSLGPNQ